MLRPTTLAGHIGKSVAGSGTDAYHERETYATIHEIIKDATCEYATHSAALKNKRSLFIYDHSTFICSANLQNKLTIFVVYM